MSLNFQDDDEPVLNAASASAPSGAKKTVEQWAEAKGLYPQFFAAPAVGLPAGTQPGPFGTVPINVGALVGRTPNPNYGAFAAAKVSLHWPEGKEMTEAEFDAAIATANGHVGR